MTKQELGNKLKHMYENAPKGNATTMILLFGIEYSQEIKQCNDSIKDILEFAEMGASYQTEISKGIRLATYVQIK